MKNIKKFFIIKDLSMNGVILKKGDVVYQCACAIYGACAKNEIACTFSSNGDYPFFGVDKKYLKCCD